MQFSLSTYNQQSDLSLASTRVECSMLRAIVEEESLFHARRREMNDDDDNDDLKKETRSSWWSQSAEENVVVCVNVSIAGREGNYCCENNV